MDYMDCVFCDKERKKMRHLRWVAIVICVVGLMAVRLLQEQLFYDPLLKYFQSDYHNQPLPEIILCKHFLSMTLRYSLNTFLSIIIIYLLFKNWGYTKFSFFVYLVGYLLFFAFYFYFIQTKFSLGFTAGFYVRRLVIQPIILLLLIPVLFYIQKQSKLEKK